MGAWINPRAKGAVGEPRSRSMTRAPAADRQGSEPGKPWFSLFTERVWVGRWVQGTGTSDSECRAGNMEGLVVGRLGRDGVCWWRAGPAGPGLRARAREGEAALCSVPLAFRVLPGRPCSGLSIAGICPEQTTGHLTHHSTRVTTSPAPLALSSCH